MMRRRQRSEVGISDGCRSCVEVGDSGGDDDDEEEEEEEGGGDDDDGGGGGGDGGDDDADDADGSTSAEYSTQTASFSPLAYQIPVARMERELELGAGRGNSPRNQKKEPESACGDVNRRWG
ncbi:hypothetical protein E4U21_007444 [Claviceps maximensis]|nr:hypothetical protein E4U21_007444 [Claviceps maximensis]